MSCFSSAVPSRLASVLRRMSVRTSMLCRLPPFSFRAPFPSFRVLLGVSVSPCVRTPSSSYSPGLREGCTVHFLASSSCLSPLLFLAPRSCPVRQPCFRFHAGPASVPLTPRAAPRLLLPLVFCRQAYGPCLSSSFHLAPFALASPAPAQHEFLHSSWLSSVLALFSLSAPCPPWIPPWLATVRVTRKLVRLAKSSREKASFSPRSWSSRATPWAA